MNAEHTNASQTSQGRDGKGRFTPGNPGGPGNPFARKVAALRKALIDSVTPQDIQDVAGRLIQLAKEGDVQAAKLLLTYVIGKPQPAPEPDRMDADEWACYQETMPMKQESAAVISALDPAFHLACVRTTRPVVTGLMRDKLIDRLRETPQERKAREDAAATELEQSFGSPADVPDLLGMDQQAKAPSANGKKRPAPRGHDHPQPSTNGDLLHGR